MPGQRAGFFSFKSTLHRVGLLLFQVRVHHFEDGGAVFLGYFLGAVLAKRWNW